MRTKTVLSVSETAIISSIPEAEKALKLYHGLDIGILDAREGRLQLGKLLVVIHDKIAKKGPTGLLTKWLISVHIDRSRAYRCMSVAAPDRFKATKQKPSCILRMKVLTLLGQLKKADGPKKIVVFDRLVDFIKKNWM